MPKAFAATCDAKPSTFACPEPLKDVKEEVKERVTTVVLSTTAKYKKKMKKKQAEKGGEDESVAMDVATSAAEEEAAAATTAAADAAAAAEAETEADSFVVTNPGRVVPAQRGLMRLDPSLRWLPISSTTALAGVVVLKDATPDVATTDDDFVQVALSEGGASLSACTSRAHPPLSLYLSLSLPPSFPLSLFPSFPLSLFPSFSLSYPNGPVWYHHSPRTPLLPDSDWSRSPRRQRRGA